MTAPGYENRVSKRRPIGRPRKSCSAGTPTWPLSSRACPSTAPVICGKALSACSTALGGSSGILARAAPGQRIRPDGPDSRSGSGSIANSTCRSSASAALRAGYRFIHGPPDNTQAVRKARAYTRFRHSGQVCTWRRLAHQISPTPEYHLFAPTSLQAQASSLDPVYGRGARSGRPASGPSRSTEAGHRPRERARDAEHTDDGASFVAEGRHRALVQARRSILVK